MANFLPDFETELPVLIYTGENFNTRVISIPVTEKQIHREIFCICMHLAVHFELLVCSITAELTLKQAIFVIFVQICLSK